MPAMLKPNQLVIQHSPTRLKPTFHTMTHSSHAELDFLTTTQSRQPETDILTTTHSIHANTDFLTTTQYSHAATHFLTMTHFSHAKLTVWEQQILATLKLICWPQYNPAMLKLTILRQALQTPTRLKHIFFLQPDQTFRDWIFDNNTLFRHAEMTFWQRHILDMLKQTFWSHPDSPSCVVN
jgi:hypothetical protein